MVRLEADGIEVESLSFTMFQFHNGSIRSALLEMIVNLTHRVSIPQWFD